MNLSSLSDADLDLIVSAVKNADNTQARILRDAVNAEITARETSGRSVKTGWRIEFYKGYDNKWADGKDSYFGPYTKVGRFFPTQEAAEAEIEKINKNIKARLYEGWTTKIKPQDVRFVKVTTTREIV